MTNRPTAEPLRHGRPSRYIAGHLIATLAACTALAACQDPVSPPAATATAPAPAESSLRSAETPTAPSHGPLYQATDKPCELVDHQLLAQIFGSDSTNITPPLYTKNKITTTMACNRSYGRRGANTTVVPVRIQLADPLAIEAQYQGLRDLHKRRAVLTDVPGLGQSAYTYLDKSTGPQLALYDGTAYLTIGAVPITGSTKPAVQVLPVLIQVARKVLANLKTSAGTRPVGRGAVTEV